MDSDSSKENQDSPWRYSLDEVEEISESDSESAARISRRKVLGAAGAVGAATLLGKNLLDQPASSSRAKSPDYYSWKNEEELYDQTGFTHPERPNTYLGVLSAEEVENVLEEKHVDGTDSSGTLTNEELEMDLDDITAVDSCRSEGSMYALDVDKRWIGGDPSVIDRVEYTLFPRSSKDEVQYYVQLVGEDPGGLYLTRGGAREISELDLDQNPSEC